MVAVLPALVGRDSTGGQKPRLLVCRANRLCQGNGLNPCNSLKNSSNWSIVIVINPPSYGINPSRCTGQHLARSDRAPGDPTPTRRGRGVVSGGRTCNDVQTESSLV